MKSHAIHIAYISFLALSLSVLVSCVEPVIEEVNVLPAIPSEVAAFYPDRFKVNGYGLFGTPKMLANTDTIITLSSGDEQRVQLGVLKFVTWDGGLSYDNTKGFMGKGLCMSADMPVYWVVEGDMKGTWISAGHFFIGGDLEFAYQAKAGIYEANEVGQFFCSYLKATSSEQVEWKAFERGTQGAQVQYVDADKQEWSGDYGRYYAHVIGMDFFEDEDEDIFYSVDLEWHTFVDKDWYLGIRANKNDKGQVVSIIQPFEYKGERIHLANYNEEESSSSRKSPKLHPSYSLGNMDACHACLPYFLQR